MSKEWVSNPNLYEKKAKFFTRKYANPMKSCITLGKWDFTFDELSID